MNKNDDFSKRAAVHAGQIPWTPSPTKGVDRRMLDRVGDEVARATTIVRYAPGSKFPSHVHSGGEEFLVLEGVFQDEHGDYPTGTYVRNPPTTEHTPGSEEGCVILVKLWQFNPADRNQFHIKTAERASAMPLDQSDLLVTHLHEDDIENVRIEHWPAHSTIRNETHDGIEIFVLEGEFVESGETFKKWSWLRLPPGHPLDAKVANAGHSDTKVWVKSGHLSAKALSSISLPEKSND